MEWVEASGRTVDVAVAAALAELGLESRELATIEVLQEPKAGFLGIGAQDAIVKVSAKPVDRNRRRRRGRGGRGGRDEAPERSGDRASQPRGDRNRKPKAAPAGDDAADKPRRPKQDNRGGQDRPARSGGDSNG